MICFNQNRKSLKSYRSVFKIRIIADNCRNILPLVTCARYLRQLQQIAETANKNWNKSWFFRGNLYINVLFKILYYTITLPHFSDNWLKCNLTVEIWKKKDVNLQQPFMAKVAIEVLQHKLTLQEIS